MNVHFQRKLAGDELTETLFFATGEHVIKEKLPDFRILRVPGFEIKIANFRNILVNNEKCRSVSEAKFVIQSALS